MDFVFDVLFDGRRLRALTLLDVHTRDALAIEVDQGIKEEQVFVVTALCGAPRSIRVDNGPEFVSRPGQAFSFTAHNTPAASAARLFPSLA